MRTYAHTGAVNTGPKDSRGRQALSAEVSGISLPQAPSGPGQARPELRLFTGPQQTGLPARPGDRWLHPGPGFHTCSGPLLPYHPMPGQASKVTMKPRSRATAWDQLGSFQISSSIPGEAGEPPCAHRVPGNGPR